MYALVMSRTRIRERGREESEESEEWEEREQRRKGRGTAWNE
jgi:hypothetical protein